MRRNIVRGVPLVPPRLGVDLPSTFNLIGTLVTYLSVAFLLPMFFAIGVGDAFWPFLASAAITLGVGLGAQALTRGRDRVGIREGFLVVALLWLLLPAFGALPYFLAGEGSLERPLDAYFESVSGFTATGATIINDFESLSKSFALWRQFTQWVGGMGILVLAIAVLPRMRVGGRYLLHSELAGPTELERFTVSIREAARRLWVLYVALTGLAILVLSIFGWTGIDPAMDVYEAAAHAFTSISLGGFSTQATSIGAFGSATQWALIGFMAVAGINFLRLYQAMVQRQPGVVARDQEIRLYALLLLVGSALLLAELIGNGIETGETAVRQAMFSAVSIMTTAGFSVADYTTWGPLAALTLLALMFVGATAGSTGGSIKVIRHLLMGKLLRREMEQIVHREAVIPIRLSGTSVDERMLRSVAGYIVLYVAILGIGSIGLVIESRRGGIDVQAFEAIGAAAAALGNIGPAFGFAGPVGSYAPFSDVSKGILIALMWLGRLEILPVLVLLTRTYWRA